MQCPVCSNEVDPQSAFCNRCGSPMTAAAAGAGIPTQPYTPTQPGYTAQPGYAAQPVAASPGLSANAASAIAYLTIIPAIILLVLEPYNRIALVRFHAWQSLGLGVAAVLIQIMVSICEVSLHFIPGVVLLFILVHLVVGLGLFVAWLIAILKASKGLWFKLPLIGDFAEKQARGTNLAV